MTTSWRMCLGAAAPGFGRDQGAECLGGLEAGQVAGRGRVGDGPSLLVVLGLGEQAGQFHLPGMGPAVVGLAGPPGGLGWRHRHPGPVDLDIQRARQRPGGPERDHPAGQDRRRFGFLGGAGGGAVGFGGAFHPLDGQADPGQLGQQGGGPGERDRGRGVGGHRAQPRRQRRVRCSQLRVAGHDTARALAAVVVGAAHGDRPEHRVDDLVPVGHEPGLVPGAAIHRRAAVPGIQGQQVFQQARAQPGHRGPDRQFHRRQALPGAQGPGRQRRQPLYLGGRLRREPCPEPPFSPSGSCGPGGSPAAGAAAGRASQIASFTSTICSVSAANCW